MKIFKKIILTIVLTTLVGCTNQDKESKINIISTSFPGYDFARAITKNVEDVNVEMLLKPVYLYWWRIRRVGKQNNKKNKSQKNKNNKAYESY